MSLIEQPKEILMKIFGYLEWWELCRCAMVCKRFLQTSESNILWYDIYMRERTIVKIGKFSVHKCVQCDYIDCRIQTHYENLRIIKPKRIPKNIKLGFLIWYAKKQKKKFQLTSCQLHKMYKNGFGCNFSFRHQKYLWWDKIVKNLVAIWFKNHD